MRILFLTQHFAPHFEGGTESVVRAAAEALVAAGHELLVVAGRDVLGVPVGDPAEREERTLDTLRVVHLAPRAADAIQPLNDRLMLERPVLLDALLAEVRAFAPDLVHVHHQATLSLDLVPTLAAAGLPVVVSLHDLFASCPRFFRVPPAELVERLGLVCPLPPDANGGEDHLAPCIECIADEAVGVPRGVLAEAFRERRRRFALELDAASRVLAPSRSHARRLEAELGREPGSIGVLENGLVAPLPRLAAPPEPSAGEPLELLYLGHRARVKGLAELCRAAAEAARHSPRPLRLVCHGAALEEDLEAELVELAAASDGLTLELHGAYARADLPRLAVGAHVAVFPSRAPESYGLVVDEALALGLPVLCAESGALAERLPEGAGLALPPPLPVDRDGGAATARWAEELERLAEVPGILSGWRAAIPDRIPGPDDLARRLVDLYAPLVP